MYEEPSFCSLDSQNQVPKKDLVGTTGFEPVTTTPPVWCATRLRYAPNQRLAIVLDSITIEMGLDFSSSI